MCEALLITIAALVSDAASRRRLETAVQGYARLRFCESADDLVLRVADGAATAVVAEWRDSAGGTVRDMVVQLRSDYPAVPILVYAPLTQQGAKDLLEASDAGATDTIIADYDDLGVTLSRRISVANSVALGECLLARIGLDLPAGTVSLVRFYFRNGRSAPPVPVAARTLGINRRALTAQCTAAGLPSPSTLASWTRIMIAAQLLEDPSCTAVAAAAELRFATVWAFRKTLRRLTGLTPSEVRERGGSGCVFELFASRVADGAGTVRRPERAATQAYSPEARGES